MTKAVFPPRFDGISASTIVVSTGRWPIVQPGSSKETSVTSTFPVASDVSAGPTVQRLNALGSALKRAVAEGGADGFDQPGTDALAKADRLLKEIAVKVALNTPVEVGVSVDGGIEITAVAAGKMFVIDISSSGHKAQLGIWDLISNATESLPPTLSDADMVRRIVG